MQWVTREHVKVGRIACSWLITRWIDPEAKIHYLPRADVLPFAERTGAIPFHSPGAEINHRKDEASFEVLLRMHGPSGNPALEMLARIVNGADTDNRKFNQPEGPGVRAVTDGIEVLFESDDDRVRHGILVFDALYAYCERETSSSTSRQ